jgi:calcium-dependent protein kinase
MMSELTVLKKCSHPNIMNVNELLEDDQNYYIVSELLEGGELFDRILEVQKFDEYSSAHILKQVLLAINYMHQKNITHRDLKPENILLEYKDKDKLDIKISDFGFSCFYDPKSGLDLVLGSPLYMAPEIIRGHVYTEKVDIWAIGVISYMLLSGRNPYPGKTKQEVKYLICSKDVDLTKPYFRGVSDEAKDFIMKCLNKNIEERYSAK